MYEQITQSINNNPENLAYIYYGNNTLTCARRYHQIKSESEQIKDSFNQVPKGVIIAVQLGKKPCLLPVIYCLLELKIAFILLNDDESNYDDYDKKITIHSIITCRKHGKKTNLSPKNLYKKTKIEILTSLGCNYELSFINVKSPKENLNSFDYSNICYIISTSGTLGRKKIVKVTENSIFSNIKSFIKLFEITPNDVIYFGTPLTFDPSLVELFLALTTGACLIATSKDIRNNPQKLLEILFVHNQRPKTFDKCVTFMQMCPSVFLQFSTEQIDFILNKSGLKTLGLGGEQFPSHITPENSSTSCKIYNFYGITEVSCWASVEPTIFGAEISLGTPLDETEFQIKVLSDGRFVRFIDLLKNNQMCEGILYIGSKTRICYIDDEDDHKKVDDIDFNNDKIDNLILRNTGDLVKVQNGKIFYIGRENDVIKRFGHRISLIKLQELIYSSIHLVNHCIFYKNKIFCFLQICNESIQKNNEFKHKTIDKIQVKLLKSLSPEFMPDFFEILNEFPVKENSGKLDKNKLEEIAHQALINYQNQCNNKLKNDEVFLKMWRKYLGITEDANVSEFYDRNFWDSGGNSICAMQFAQEFENLTGMVFNRSLFDLCLKEVVDFVSKEDENVKNCKNGLLDDVFISSAYSARFNVVWKRDMKACVDTTPTVCKISGQNYIAVGNFSQTFSIFHAEAGIPIASIDLPNVIEGATLVFNNEFYIPCFDGTLYCYHLKYSNSEAFKEDKDQLELLWAYKTGAQIKNKPIFDGTNIVFGSYDGYIYALTQEGVLSWKTLLAQPVTAEIKHFEAKLFIAGLKGTICCLTSANGVKLWTYNTQNPIFSSPEISTTNNCILFVDIQGWFYCFSLRTSSKSLLWTFDPNTISTSLKTFASMTIFNNQIFIGCQQGTVNRLSFSEASCAFENSTALNNSSSITTKALHMNIKAENYLLVVNSSGYIYLFRVKDKDHDSKLKDKSLLVLRGRFSLPNECFSSPQGCIVYENRFFVGCRDNSIYCIEINV